MDVQSIVKNLYAGQGRPMSGGLADTDFGYDPALKAYPYYTEATRIVHEDKPWLELFQEVVIYGVGQRVSFKPRADYRLPAAEMTLAR